MKENYIRRMTKCKCYVVFWTEECLRPNNTNTTIPEMIFKGNKITGDFTGVIIVLGSLDPLELGNNNIEGLLPNIKTALSHL